MKLLVPGSPRFPKLNIIKHTMPLFAVCFIIFSLGNLGLPGTSSFIGEFLIIAGSFETNS
jgi:NADH-quinone oxidoreductase subunit M